MYYSLQLLRAFAAVAVVVYHVGVAFSSDKYFAVEWMGRWFAAGRYGVDLFFVLSGYIISVAHGKEIGHPGKAVNYLRKRFVRIYPTFWAIFVAVWLSALATRSNIPYDPLVLLKALLLVSQDPAVVGPTGAPVLIVAWSLHYEVLFYLLFLLLVLGWRISGIAILAGALLGALLPNVHIAGSVGAFLADKYTHLFIFGVAAGLFRRKLPFGVNAAHFVLASSLFLVCLGVFLTASGAGLDDRLQAYLVGALSILLLISTAVLEDARVNFARFRFSRAVGDASYSLYLVHYPLISICCKLGISVAHGHLPGVVAEVAAALLVIAVCISASLAVHRWIERPVIASVSTLLLKRGRIHA